MSAEDQIKTIVARIEEVADAHRGHRHGRPEIIPKNYKLGPKFAADPTSDGPSIRDAEYLFSIVAPLARIAGMDDEDEDGRRTLMLASRLLGVNWAQVYKALADARMFGTTAAAEAWAAFLRPSDKRLWGSLYAACAPTAPDIVKIGFSRNATKRARSLSRQHREPIVLLHEVPGTMLHEWVIHQVLWTSRVAPEWYRRSDIPAWLLPRAIESGVSA